MAAYAIQTTMHRLYSAGLSVTLTPEKGLKVTPASAITDAMRALIVVHKVDIVTYLSDAANDPPSISAKGMAPDRWCYPRTQVMNAAGNALFAARLARFTDKGLEPNVGERLAERLVIRDIEQDDRVVCLECTHLQRGWRCANWQRAGIAIRSSDAQLGTEFVHLLQRCDGFKGA
jgi:hypothetical protein